MRLPEFEFLEPRSVDEARAMLAQDPDGSVVLAGGTDILVSLREGGVQHRRLVSLNRIDGLERIEYSGERGLSIGAMATVVLGLSFWAYVAFAICFTAAMASLDRIAVWDEIERCSA